MGSDKETKSNMPLHVARDGGLSIAIFNGTYGKNAVVQKSYLKRDGDKDNKDDWVRSNINLFMNELPKLKNTIDEICEKFADEIKASEKPKDE